MSEHKFLTESYEEYFDGYGFYAQETIRCYVCGAVYQTSQEITESTGLDQEVINHFDTNGDPIMDCQGTQIGELHGHEHEGTRKSLDLECNCLFCLHA